MAIILLFSTFSQLFPFYMCDLFPQNLINYQKNHRFAFKRLKIINLVIYKFNKSI